MNVCVVLIYVMSLYMFDLFKYGVDLFGLCVFGNIYSWIMNLMCDVFEKCVVVFEGGVGVFVVLSG